jgi:hypothetical protein
LQNEADHAHKRDSWQSGRQKKHTISALAAAEVMQPDAGMAQLADQFVAQWLKHSPSGSPDSQSRTIQDPAQTSWRLSNQATLFRERTAITLQLLAFKLSALPTPTAYNSTAQTSSSPQIDSKQPFLPATMS